MEKIHMQKIIEKVFKLLFSFDQAQEKFLALFH